MEGYICKECGAEVIIKDNGEKVRSCGHNSTIVLSLEVVVTGESNIE